VSVHKDPALIYSPLEQDELIGSAEPAVRPHLRLLSRPHNETPIQCAFYKIYASAWFLMSIFAHANASALADNEPTEPLVYVLSALAACEEGQKALDTRKQERFWDVSLVACSQLL
jgi:hypothetical protein